MSIQLVFLIRLREGVRPSDFEKFVIEVERPMVASWDSVLAQRVLRVDDLFDLEGEQFPVDFVDLIEIDDVERYRAQMKASESTPAFAAFVAGWTRLVAGDDALCTSVVADWRGSVGSSTPGGSSAALDEARVRRPS